MLIAQFTQRLHQCRRRSVETALALHRFQDDGGDTLGIDVRLEQRLQRRQRAFHADAMQFDRERYVIDLGRERAETDFVRHDFAGQRHAHHGTAMEGAGKRDHRATSGSGTGDLDGVFYRLGAGRKESGLFGMVARRDGVDTLSQFDIAGVRHDLIRGVGKFAQLFLDRGHQFRMAMAGVQDGDAGSEIDEAAVFHIPDFCVECMRGVEIAHDADTARSRGVFALMQ